MKKERYDNNNTSHTSSRATLKTRISAADKHQWIWFGVWTLITLLFTACRHPVDLALHSAFFRHIYH